MEGVRKGKENVLRTSKPFMGHMDLAPAWRLVSQKLIFHKWNEGSQCFYAPLPKGETACCRVQEVSTFPLHFFCLDLDFVQEILLAVILALHLVLKNAQKFSRSGA